MVGIAKKRSVSVLESSLAFQIRVCGLPVPEREYRFHPTRKWRFDFAWLPPQHKIAVEVDGGVWVNGRHNRALEADIEKGNAAVLEGWSVLHFTGKHIRTGEAISMIEQALGRQRD